MKRLKVWSSLKEPFRASRASGLSAGCLVVRDFGGVGVAGVMGLAEKLLGL